jgi:hypothetical protein
MDGVSDLHHGRDDVVDFALELLDACGMGFLGGARPAHKIPFAREEIKNATKKINGISAT